MSQKEVEFTYLAAKVVGNDTVVFRLEDGAQVIVRVDINRAGFRINPSTGSRDYNFEFNNTVKVVPHDKKFKALVPEQPPPKKDGGYIK